MFFEEEEIAGGNAAGEVPFNNVTITGNTGVVGGGMVNPHVNAIPHAGNKEASMGLFGGHANTRLPR